MEPRSRSVLWVIIWIAAGLALGLWILFAYGTDEAAEYHAAYFLEKSLSVDNIFVFAVVFSELHVPAEQQRRVLTFGIRAPWCFGQ